MTHYWRLRRWLPDRHGMGCKILATGRMNSVLIEFEDGVRHITSRWAIRKRKTEGTTP